MSIVLTPQKGPQEMFLATPADICIYGGSAGGGKSYALLLQALRYKNVKGFGCTIFRKNFKQIFSQGGLWDESTKMYYQLANAIPTASKGQWSFVDDNGVEISRINFDHIERDEEVHKFQGSQIPAICFDELTHFSKKIFFYMLSRNRSMCGVKPYVKATCNPDAESWVAEFIEWWIDQDTGYPIKERSGVLRYFIRRGEDIYWADTKEELWERFNLKTPEELAEPKSVTFISSSIYDNQALLKTNPEYLANLKALAEIDRERLLHGNWKIKSAAGLYFKRTQVANFLEVLPADIIKYVRCWDLAATSQTENGEAAYTAGVLLGKRRCGTYVVIDVINRQLDANDVRQLIKQTAQQDRAKYKRVTIRLPQDPGQAGKEQAKSYIKFLAGFNVKAVAESGSKEARAEPMASQWQAGNFDLMIANWNDMYLSQLESFPESKWKDMVDASANAFAEIESGSNFNVRNLV